MWTSGNVSVATLSFVFLLLTSFCPGAARSISKSDNYKHPVILVPGDGGCQAYVRHRTDSKNAPKLIWLTLKAFFELDSVTQKFSLHYNEKTGRHEGSDEYEITFPGWGDTETVATLDTNEKIFGRYFDGIIEDLKRDPFFVSNKSIRGAPFDFRRAPNENEQFFIRLKDLVEETYRLNGNKRVILVGHSMGCLFLVTFLERQTLEWKQQYVKSFVSLAGPYGGAVKTLKVAASGENFGAFFRSPLAFRKLQRTFPSLFFMVPDKRLWAKDEALVTTHNKTYTSKDFEQFFQDIGYPLGYRMMQQTKTGTDYFQGPTGVDEVYCIYGTGIDTPSQMVYQPPSLMRRAFPDQVPAVLSGDGDGTVNLRSLQLCKRWSNVIPVELPQSEHLFIMRDPRMLNILRAVAGFSER